MNGRTARALRATAKCPVGTGDAAALKRYKLYKKEYTRMSKSARVRVWTKVQPA